MEGTIKLLTGNGQRAAAITEYGYTVFDLESGQVSMGDVVSGDLDTHGSEILTNRTSGKRLNVYIEAIHATQSAAAELLRSL